MRSRVEKGGATFEGLKLLLCENPLPPIDEAIAAAQAEAPRGNYYTEPYSAPLRRLLASTPRRSGRRRGRAPARRSGGHLERVSRGKQLGRVRGQVDFLGPEHELAAGLALQRGVAAALVRPGQSGE
jgi:hypothetical protein